MGYYHQKITINGHRSAHNSINDELDKVRWQFLLKEIQRVCDREDYKDLELSVDECLD